MASTFQVHLQRTQGEDDFASCSDNIVLRILFHLDHKSLIRASKVNRRFRKLALHPSMWTELSLYVRKDLETHYTLLERCTLLKCLTLSECSYYRTDGDELAIHALRHCPSLTDLHLDECDFISTDLLDEIHGSALKILTITSEDSAGFSLKDLKTHSGFLKQLTTLKVPFGSLELIEAMDIACTSLEVFAMSDTIYSLEGNLEDTCTMMNYLYNSSLKKTIKELHLGYGCFPSEESFNGIINFQLLQELTIYDGTTSAVMTALGLTTISQLTSLQRAFVNCRMVLTDKQIIAVMSANTFKGPLNLNLRGHHTLYIPRFGLSDEIILQIFSYLDHKCLLKASLVNKRLRKLALDPSLWTSLSLFARKKLDTHCNLLKRCRLLDCLTLSSHHKYEAGEDELAIYALKRCPLLNKLVMKDCDYLSTKLLKTIWRSKLKILKIQSQENAGFRLEDVQMQYKFLEKLTTLEVPFGSLDLIQVMDFGCENLENFAMGNTIYSLSGPACEMMKYFYHSSVKDTLKTLHLGHGCFPSEASFQGISDFQLLEYLTIDDNSQEMTVLGLQAISQLSSLQKVNIYCKTQLSDEEISAALKINTFTTAVILNFGSDRVLRVSAQVHFRSFPDEVILKIFSYLCQECLLQASPVNKRFRRLALDPTLWTELVISVWSDSEELTALYKVLLERCNLLEYLEFTPYFEKADEVGIHALRHCPHLTTLFMNRCWLLSLALLKAIGESSLRTLIIESQDSVGFDIDLYVGFLEHLTTLEVLFWLS